MRLTLTRNRRKDGTFKDGCSDAWTASLGEPGEEVASQADTASPPQPTTFLTGIGKSRVDAIGSLVGANLKFFGIDERMDIDPGSATPEVLWRASDWIKPVNGVLEYSGTSNAPDGGAFDVGTPNTSEA